jgi:hypothetical protein
MAEPTGSELMDEMQRLKSAAEAVRCQLLGVERMLHLRRLAEARILPGQRGDGLLREERIKFTKANMSMSTIFAEIDGVERLGRMLRVSGRGRVAGAMTAALRKALRRIVGLSLGQMHDPGQPQAGQIEVATIDPDGLVRISALVGDGPAVLKTRARVYPGISIRFDGDEITEVALVDRDFSKLAKGAGAADTVLANIYSKEDSQMSGDQVNMSVPELIKRLNKAGLTIAPIPQAPIVLGAGSPQERRDASARALSTFKSALAKPIGYSGLRPVR